MVLRTVATLLLLSLLLCPEVARGAPPRPRGHYLPAQTLFGREVLRDGFHLHVSFGLGGGPDTIGVSHAMELGWTLQRGTTLGLIHAFIQSRGVFTDVGGPDLIGGWMLMVKVPVLFPELVYKVAAGPGGTHDQSDGIVAHWGPAWLYGFDLHLPIWPTSGPSVSLFALHAVAERQHHFGVALTFGYTWF